MLHISIFCPCVPLISACDMDRMPEPKTYIAM